MTQTQNTRLVRSFDSVNADDIAIVGGKNASLGEMITRLESSGIRVPGGFATTAAAYWRFIEHNTLEKPLRAQLKRLGSGKELTKIGKAIRALILESDFPEDLEAAIRTSYDELCKRYQSRKLDVAVRSSATAEDLPQASFAGQQESFLNIRGPKALLETCRQCYASLFTDRAITYREHNKFDHMKVALSIGVQKMIRSDKACAGVAFTIDTETGFPRVVIVNGSWGLGEMVVKGLVTPDEFRLFKPLLSDSRLRPILEKKLGGKKEKLIYGGKKGSPTVKRPVLPADRKRFVLTDDELLQLGRWAVAIEQHYGRPMDIEWAKDGKTGELYIVQARPETVQSQTAARSLNRYALKKKGGILISGAAIGSAIASGPVKVLRNAANPENFPQGGVLVAELTDPDWVPVMKRASAVVTDQGGRTSHAAIVSRELGIPAIIGTQSATTTLRKGQIVTVSCAEGETGNVYEGKLPFEVTEFDLETLPKTRTHLMLNVANPEAAMSWWKLPCEGIGLARLEFVINHVIKVHPLALLMPDKVENKRDRDAIKKLTKGFENPADYFVTLLAQGIAKIAASRHPDPVIVRFSDFKTNEYANLLGGAAFEPHEENPMLGFRGASRYYSEAYKDAFRLECRALRRARDTLGLRNVRAMIPFCRTLDEADRVIKIMRDEGLERGKDEFELYVMAEIPSNIVLADEFAQRFDGFSIGSNDLTQLVLGVDRDSTLLRHVFDERNSAVTRLIESLIERAHAHGRHVGICGQGPSDHPDFAEFLVKAGIDSISLNPDSLIDVRQRIAKLETSLAQ